MTGLHIDALGAGAAELVSVQRLADAARERGLRVSLSLEESSPADVEADVVWRGSGVPGWFEGARAVGGDGAEDGAGFKRALAFGLLTSRALLAVPWALDEEAVEITRHFTRFKNRLMPYLLAAAADASARGLPLVRAMAVEFPDDPACTDLAGQCMLGPSLLVAPVATADGTVQVYVPDGVWTSPLTGERVTGGRWVTETHSADSIPVYVRPGAIIAWGSELSGPTTTFWAG